MKAEYCHLNWVYYIAQLWKEYLHHGYVLQLKGSLKWVNFPTPDTHFWAL